MGKIERIPVIRDIYGYIRRNLGTIAGLILLSIIVSLSTPKFLTGDNLLNLFKSNAVNAIISCGMLLAILMADIDISVGSVVGLSSIVSAYCITNLGLPVWIAVIASLAVGMIIGLINGVSVSYIGVPAFVATLATMSVGRGITEILSDGISIRIRNDSFTALGTVSIGDISIIVIYAVVIMFITWLLLNKTRFGQYLFAIGGNKLAAQYSGINVKKHKLMAFVYIGLLSSIGGIIWAARLGSATATLGAGFEMDAIAAVVIGGTSMSGGVGTVGGTLIGVLIIGVLNNGLNLMGINSFWQDVFKGVIIIAAVVIDIVRKKRAENN